jgi:hypothetical protein
MPHLLIVLAMLLPLAARAQLPELPPEMREAVDSVPVAPPELAAHAYLRLVETMTIEDLAWKRELLERAWRLAPSARYPMKFAVAPGVVLHTDTDAGLLLEGTDLGLDASSLRYRAWKQMLRIDPEFARAWFAGWPYPDPPPTNCGSALVYDPGQYHEAARLLYSQSFTGQEREDGQHLLFLEDHIRRINSPYSLEPVAAMLSSGSFSGAELDRLGATYFAVLDSVSLSGARSAGSLLGPAWNQRVLELATRCHQTGADLFPLAGAYRNLFVRVATGPRCRDHHEQIRKSNVIETVTATINEDLRGKLGALGELIPPIEAADLVPSEVEGSAEVFDFWESESTRALLMGAKRLRFGTPEPSEERQRRGVSLQSDRRAAFLSEEERRQPEWEAALMEQLRRMDEWDAQQKEPPLMRLHQLCLLYQDIIELTPEGELRSFVVRQALSMLAQSPAMRDDPPQWFVHLKRLMNVAAADEPARARLHEQIRNHGNAVMLLFADLENLIDGREPPA